MENDNNYRKSDSVFSRKVRAGKRRTYFFDVRQTKGNDYYLTLTESTRRFNGDGYERHKIFLYKEDFNLLIVDQRSGGQRFGDYNRTVAAITQNYEYCEAYPDFVASVDFLRSEGYTGDILVWGSSYSAALLFN